MYQYGWYQKPTSGFMPYVFQGEAPLSREGKGCQKVVIPETEGIPTPESVKLHEKMT
jgi:hypothetical protein